MVISGKLDTPFGFFEVGICLQLKSTELESSSEADLVVQHIYVFHAPYVCAADLVFIEETAGRIRAK